jgi:hypothetical protein
MPFTLTITLPDSERNLRVAQHPTTDPGEDEYGEVDTPTHPTAETPKTPDEENKRPADERGD